MKKMLCVLMAAICVASVTFISGCDKAVDRSVYTIEASLEDKTVTARMKLDYYNDTQSELNSLAFHLYPNAYSEGGSLVSSDLAAAFPRGASYGKIDISEVKSEEENLQYEVNGDIMTVTVPSLFPTQRIQVEMAFAVTLPEGKHRLGYFEGKYNLGNWYPVLCAFDTDWKTHPYYVNGDPFDSSVADYYVTLNYPSSLTAVSSGGIGSGGTLSAKAINVRDFAVVLGEFNVKTASVGDIKINYCSEGEEDRTPVISQALSFFSDTFGKYAYDEYNVVRTAFFSGGMEYPAMCFVSDALDEKTSEEVIIHETAHQWWYAAVGNDQVYEAWLDEGLAEYSTTVFYEKHSNYGIKRENRIADSLTTYSLYCEIYTHGKQTPMRKCVGDYVTVSDYTFNTYVRGQLMLDSLRTVIGDKAFFEGLKLYYKENSGKVATAANLIGAMEKTSARNLQSYFDSWLSGKTMLYSVS